ncbi:hypothetical protein [Alicyclobacillus sp. ALC3]|uniref:hypothetical protein n=1 Tax=Alicyclobacillus sp. ALC3 TaxID=2796143 RepID=UPI0023799A59|nr:hypothetical protein [Alicyclobacillus sp. ALC3]WDL97961.1 hypothetical protein JC200_04400 [Alicyclobacillus sp. ALC3]
MTGAGENHRIDSLSWHAVRLPEGSTLVRKHTFEYTTAANMYDLELYEHQDKTWHAIALPRGGSRVIIYGSNVVDTAQMAIQVVVDKIRREGLEAWDEPAVSETDAEDTESEH